jgi:hypothetical protein
MAPGLRPNNNTRSDFGDKRDGCSYNLPTRRQESSVKTDGRVLPYAWIIVGLTSGKINRLSLYVGR